ncbi:type IV toxin-antitoxin system AbiEi family antitoxin domain-containing protein [Gordonia sinesedis]
MALRRLLAIQDGVITRRQARDCGLSDSAISRRVGTGEWIAVARGVLRVADRTVDDRIRARIAVAAVGERAVLAGGSAAWWHGLTDRVPSPHLVLAPRGRHGATIPGVRVWHRDVTDEDVVVRDALRVTAMPLTVLDASVDLGVWVMDAALLRKRVTIPQLAQAQIRNRGRRGSPRSRAMLAAMSAGARSEAERLLLALLRRSAITGWRANYPVDCRDSAPAARGSNGYLIDVAFPAVKVAIEIDGFAFHSDAVAFQHDRRRQNDLVAAGWTVLRFTWHDLVDRPAYVITRIRAAVLAAAA